MFGYIICDKNELKGREIDIYQGYYCGVCKSAGKRIDQLSRLALSYDAAFLALVLDSLSDEVPKIGLEHCFVHPVGKKAVIRNNPAIDYAADMMVLLAYHKAEDDLRDEGGFKAKAEIEVFCKAFDKVSKEYPEVSAAIREGLDELAALEKEKCGSIDLMSEAFAKVMRAVFTGYEPCKGCERILGELAENLGRWLYLTDALDDWADDVIKGRYNPLMYRPGGRQNLEPVLYEYLTRIHKAVDLMDIKHNRGIIENITLIGMRAVTDRVLKKGREDDGSI